MVMPINQRCPKCGKWFMGSDCIGRACWDCESIRIDYVPIRPATNDESVWAIGPQSAAPSSPSRVNAQFKDTVRQVNEQMARELSAKDVRDAAKEMEVKLPDGWLINQIRETREQIAQLPDWLIDGDEKRSRDNSLKEFLEEMKTKWVDECRKQIDEDPTILHGDGKEARDKLRDSGATMILRERARQCRELGYDSKHDDEHDRCELISAAVAMALAAKEELTGKRQGALLHWPFQVREFKHKPAVEMLVKAGALIAAEIDRLGRIE